MWPIIWANEHAKIALEHNLAKYKARIENENLDNISVAAPAVAMPILEKLTYVTNEELCELYIELLAKASIKDFNNHAHPSFVNILNNLSPDEAKLIKRFKGKEFIPFANIEVCSPTGSFITIEEYIVDLEIKSLDLSFVENLSAYFWNLASAGLITLEEDKQVEMVEAYAKHYAYLSNKKKELDIQTANFPKHAIEPYRLTKGIIKVTTFGKLFFEAVIK